jgi:TPR repeat protein
MPPKIDWLSLLDSTNEQPKSRRGAAAPRAWCSPPSKGMNMFSRSIGCAAQSAERTGSPVGERLASEFGEQPRHLSSDQRGSAGRGSSRHHRIAFRPAAPDFCIASLNDAKANYWARTAAHLTVAAIAFHMLSPLRAGRLGRSVARRDREEAHRWRHHRQPRDEGHC